jgi:rhodanese-related sulfurtransferase
MNTLACISAKDLRTQLAAGGCQLIDVREPVEFSEERLAGAKLIPLGELEQRQSELHKKQRIYVMCRGGTRGGQAAQKLAALGATDVVNLDGGILAWKAVGLPVERTARRGLPLMQQVQLIIGLGVLTGSILAVTVNPKFAFIPMFFGSGLVLAGSTGWCGLALLLAKMPWNKTAATSATSCSA